MELLQFHFHTPSEHAMDGMRSPMEVHLVSEQCGRACALCLRVLAYVPWRQKKSLVPKDGWCAACRCRGCCASMQCSRLLTGLQAPHVSTQLA